MKLAYAAETRRFEIERLWQRSLFFWTILAGAFVGYGALEGKSNVASLLVACFGLVSSVAWSLQNRGAKYWQEAWEEKTNRHQYAVLGIDLFKNKEAVQPKGFFGARRYSVSRLAIILSDFTTLIWLCLLLRSLTLAASDLGWRALPCMATGFAWLTDRLPFAIAIIAIGGCLVLVRFGRSESS